jgi:hypothetical protein
LCSGVLAGVAVFVGKCQLRVCLLATGQQQQGRTGIKQGLGWRRLYDREAAALLQEVPRSC